ncbi:Fic family protein [Pseudoflavitalea rhizosphaerae]|uniref:Fic family protein n=1 Tax=Pseudoflavitalea rhizosphaerae TaxID=1884793 RepID=UPI000F8E3014|nr:Fic family protein [Pseudoflavitalea rhizosphaerae]
MKFPERPPAYNFAIYKEVLEELFQKNKFNEFLNLTEKKYYYWNKCKYKAKEWGFEPTRLWSAVKANRISNKIISPFANLNLNVGTPSVVQKFLHEFDLNLGGNIQGDAIIPSEDRDRYLISSLMEEAIASSQLEGADTTRVLAKRMLETNRKPRNVSEQMILNNYKAMQWIVENKNQPMSIKNIKDLHTILTKDTLIMPEEVGAFREDDEVKVIDRQTGRTLHQPPSHQLLNELMEKFCEFANTNQEDFFIHPITKGVILHFLIGFIHPFADGNGRTARTIFYWHLLKKGYWLIEYMSVSRIILRSKVQYAEAFLHTELDGNDLTYFLIYNLKSIHFALEDLKKYIERKVTEKKNMITMLRGATNYNDRQIFVIQEIVKDPATFFTVKQIQSLFNTSNQTARTDLNHLVQDGLLTASKNNKAIRYVPTQNHLQILKKINHIPSGL